MITTNRFSPEAVEFARTITPRVILIDGSRLGRLMVTHGIGVQERQTFRVVETDEDLFEEAGRSASPATVGSSRPNPQGILSEGQSKPPELKNSTRVSRCVSRCKFRPAAPVAQLDRAAAF